MLSACIMSCHRTESVPEQLESFEVILDELGDQEANRLIGVEDGIVLVGTSYTENTSQILLCKVNLNGEKCWTKNLVPGAEGYSIKKMANGGFLVCGSVTASAGNKDLLLLKTDESGNLVFQKTFGGSQNDIGRDAIELQNGDLMLLGTTGSFGPGAASMYIVKTDPNGMEIWSRSFGGDGVDGGSELLQMNSVEVLILGFTGSFGAGDRDIYLQGVSLDGDSLASFIYGGASYEESQAIQPAADGGFVMCNHSASSDPTHAMVATKLNSNYQVVWEREYGSSVSHDGGEAVLADSEGNYVFIGRTNSFTEDEQVYFVKTTPDGTLIQETHFGGVGDQRGNDIIEYRGSYYICGTSTINGNSDVLISKMPM